MSKLTPIAESNRGIGGDEGGDTTRTVRFDRRSELVAGRLGDLPGVCGAEVGSFLFLFLVVFLLSPGRVSSSSSLVSPSSLLAGPCCARFIKAPFFLNPAHLSRT